MDKRDASPKRAVAATSIDSQAVDSSLAIQRETSMSASEQTQHNRAFVDQQFPTTNPKIKERLLYILELDLPGLNLTVQQQFLNFLARTFEASGGLEFGQSIAVADASAEFMIKLSRAIWLPDQLLNPYARASNNPPPPAAQNQ